MVKRFLPVLWLLAAIGQPAHAIESMLLDRVAALPIEYRLVKSCGSWQADGKEGYYRIIVGDVYDGAGSEIYVQWIEQATQEKHASLIRTLAFPELNNDHQQYYFLSVECEKKGRHTYVKAKATYEHDEADEVHGISIRLLDIGRYELSRSARAAAPRR